MWGDYIVSRLVQAQMSERVFCGHLLGFFFTAPLSFAQSIALEGYFNKENFSVIRAFFGYGLISRMALSRTLRVFEKQAFEVEVVAVGEDFFNIG